MTTKANTAVPGTEPKAITAKAPSYVKGSHAARVRSEHDERRTELLALRDVLDAQRVALVDQIEDIGAALMLLSDPGSNVVPIKAAAE